MKSRRSTTDPAAAAEAIRPHERFIVTTHEAPDGDALGSMLATALALGRWGKDAVMYLTGDVPLPREYHFMPRGELLRGPLPDDAARVPSCRGARRGGRRSAPDFPGRVRERRVRQVEAARPSARPRTTLRRRAARRLLPAQAGFRRRRRRRTVLRGDHRLPPGGRGRADGGADPRAAVEGRDSQGEPALQ